MLGDRAKVVIADGCIRLYRRDDTREPTWHAHLRLPGTEKGINRSTNERDLERAKHAALKMLGELSQRRAQNLPMRSMTFGEVAAVYLREADRLYHEGRKSLGRYEIIRGTLRRYLLPYFSAKDIMSIHRKDLMEYRAWRQNYWTSGPGSDHANRRNRQPTQGTLKQEWTVLRGVFDQAIKMSLVSTIILDALKHEPARINKRPGFTSEEFDQLCAFMEGWIAASDNARVKRDRLLLRDYVLIMANSGMRKGEARYLRWRDVGSYTNQHGEWVTLNVSGKTGERLVVCQPGTEYYFNRLRKREYFIDPDDLVFCHKDGKPIANYIGYFGMLKAAGLLLDARGQKRSVYSLRHTYATLRLENGANIYWLKQNMGTSVAMIERHYGQTRVLVGIEHETALRTMPPKPATTVDPTPAKLVATDWDE